MCSSLNPSGQSMYICAMAFQSAHRGLRAPSLRRTDVHQWLRSAHPFALALRRSGWRSRYSRHARARSLGCSCPHWTVRFTVFARLSSLSSHRRLFAYWHTKQLEFDVRRAARCPCGHGRPLKYHLPPSAMASARVLGRSDANGPVFDGAFAGSLGDVASVMDGDLSQTEDFIDGPFYTTPPEVIT